MKRNFVDVGEMEENLPYRLKAIFAFQQQDDGTELCLFGLHTQEYSSDCPDPNSRRIYLAYLDSVNFFEPSNLRTDFYRRLLVDYLDYCRQLGFLFAHIWACPPGEGDDYIFHMHPPNQKLPKPKRLQEWYIAMLELAKEEHVVVEYTDIYEYVFSSKLSNVFELPYFEGDYWQNILEEFLKEDLSCIETFMNLMDDDRPLDNDKDINEDANSRKRKLQKMPGNIKRKKAVDSSGGSDTMKRLFELVQKHKENFFVVRLHDQNNVESLGKIVDTDSLGFSELMDGRDKFLSLSREKHLEFSSRRRAKFSTTMLCYELHLELHHGIIYTCNHCDVLLDDVRYTCGTCDDYELCELCAKSDVHEHRLQRHPSLVDESQSVADTATTTPQLSKQQMMEMYNLQFGHAIMCRDANCRTASCASMKSNMRHYKDCPLKASNTCKICKCIDMIVKLHVQLCRNKHCNFTLCLRKRQNTTQSHQNRLFQKGMGRRRMFVAESASEQTVNAQEASQTVNPSETADYKRPPSKEDIDTVIKHVNQLKAQTNMSQTEKQISFRQWLETNPMYNEAYQFVCRRQSQAASQGNTQYNERYTQLQQQQQQIQRPPIASYHQQAMSQPQYFHQQQPQQYHQPQPHHQYPTQQQPQLQQQQHNQYPTQQQLQPHQRQHNQYQVQQQTQTQQHHQYQTPQQPQQYQQHIFQPRQHYPQHYQQQHMRPIMNQQQIRANQSQQGSQLIYLQHNPDIQLRHFYSNKPQSYQSQIANKKYPL